MSARENQERRGKGRLELLEDDVRELRSTQGEIFGLLREVREAQIKSEGALALAAQRAAQSACPTPGLCTQLKGQIEALARTQGEISRTQGEHEAYVQQAKGMGTLSKWLWAIFGVGGLIAALKVLFGRGS